MTGNIIFLKSKKNKSRNAKFKKSFTKFNFLKTVSLKSNNEADNKISKETGRVSFIFLENFRCNSKICVLETSSWWKDEANNSTEI